MRSSKLLTTAFVSLALGLAVAGCSKDSETLLVLPQGRLRFATQPAAATAGVAQAGITVEVVDSNGNVQKDPAGVTITLELGDNPGGASLIGGNPQVTTTNGTATFASVSVDKVGRYTLKATASGLFTGTSDPFDVSPGAVAAVRFVAPPQSAIAGNVIPAVTVELIDAQGNRVTTATDQVTLSVASGPGALGGTTTRAAVSGLATFDDLTLGASGNYVLRASSGTATPADSPTFTQNLGPIPVIGQLAITSAVANAAEGATLAALTVELRDNNGVLKATATDPVTVSIGQNPSGGVLRGTTTKAAVAGVVTFNDLSIDKAGTAYTLTVQSGGYADAVSATFDITPATADRLVFRAADQPTNTGEGQVINGAGTGQVTVEIHNANGVIEPSATTPVTISLGQNPVGGTLSGTLTKAPVAGVVTFDDLRIDLAGTGYRLTASAAGLPAVTSNAFDVTPFAARKLGFVAADQPTDTARGAVINGGTTGQVSVEVQRSDGTRVTTATDLITIVFGRNPAGGHISGIRTKAATAGVASFDDLRIDAAGNGYTLLAFSGSLTPAESNAFNITGPPPVRLEFSTQPTDTAEGATVNAPGGVVVRLLDASGALVTSATDAVTLDLGVNPAGGTLSGTRTKNAVAGVATFDDLSLDAVGNGYRLTAAASGLQGATSDPFNVTAAAAFALDIDGDPTGAPEGTALTAAGGGPVTVRILDAAGVPVTSAGTTNPVTLSLASNPQGAILSGTLTQNAVNGVASFADLRVDKAGTYTLLASSPGLQGNVSAGFTITAVSPARIAFVVQPSNVAAGATMTAPTVQLQDAFGNNLATPTGLPVTLSLAQNPATGSLGGTLTVTTNATGLATFNDLVLNNVGTGYRLRAEVAGGLEALSDPFDVTGTSTSVQTLRFVTSPSNTTSGKPMSGVQVEILDNLGARTNGTDPITLVLGSNPAPGGTLRGTLTVNAVNGLATFNGLSILEPGTYTLTAFAAGHIPGTSAPFTVSPPAFTKTTLALSGGATGPTGLAVADLSGDGRPDLATCNATGGNAAPADGSVSVFLNNAGGVPGAFAETALSPFPTFNNEPESIAIADVSNGLGALDPDGAADIILGEADAAGPGLALLGNASAGTNFPQRILSGTLPGETFGVRVANLNAVEVPPTPNSLNDFAFAQPTSAAFHFYRNEGPSGNTVTPQPNGPFATGTTKPSAPVLVDFDGDGDLDVAVGTQDFTPGAIGRLSVFLQTTSTAPAPPFALAGAVTYETGGIGPWWVESGDVDGDGNPDLVVSHRGDGGLGNQGLAFLTVLLQNGSSGTFLGSRIVNHNILRPGRFALGDINGDGALDAVVPDILAGRVLVFLGLGNGDFILGTTLTAGSGPVQAVISDLDGDGDQDIAVANQSSNDVSVFLQN